MDDISILYADDDDNDVFIFKRIARKLGVSSELHTVDDGLGAIDYLSGHGSYADRGRYPLPKIILSDLKMPRVSGIGLLRWVRQQPAFATIPFIMLSSSSYGGDIQSAYDLGANGYLVKTSSLPTLVSQMQDLLSVCSSAGFHAEGWLSFDGNHTPPPTSGNEAMHPAAVLSQSSWNPALRHSEN